MTNIPNWLCDTEEYQPKRDNASFIDRSTKSVMAVLSSFKRNNQIKRAKECNISLRLFGIFVMLVLTSVARNYSFVLFMIAFVIVKIATLNGESIKAWLKSILPVLLFSALILLPAVFMGNPKTLLTIISKIFVCVSLVLCLNLTASFNSITRALKSFFVPDIIIFTLDLTVKYIMILGDVCAKMLTALKIRSIGKSNNKQASLSGILGTVFIKAKGYVDDTSKAMECRGFNGSYSVTKKRRALVTQDYINIAIFVVVVAVFVYLEVIA